METFIHSEKKENVTDSFSVTCGFEPSEVQILGDDGLVLSWNRALGNALWSADGLTGGISLNSRGFAVSADFDDETLYITARR